MKWKQPQKGETRVRTRFALFPHLVGTNWVWLERFDEYQAFCHKPNEILKWRVISRGPVGFEFPEYVPLNKRARPKPFSDDIILPRISYTDAM